jgi:hypothetical protein
MTMIKIDALKLFIFFASLLSSMRFDSSLTADMSRQNDLVLDKSSIAQFPQTLLTISDILAAVLSEKAIEAKKNCHVLLDKEEKEFFLSTLLRRHVVFM